MNTPTKAIRFTSAGGHTYRLNINQIEVTALPDDRHKLLMDNFSKEELIKAAVEMHRGYPATLQEPSIFHEAIAPSFDVEEGK